MKYLMSLFVLLFFAQASDAQRVIEETSDPKATSILDKVNQLNQLTSYEIDFVLKIKSPEVKAPETMHGKFIKKGKKYRVITPDQKIYSNGESTWIYAPKSNQVQLNDVDEDDSNFISPDKLFEMYNSGDYLYHFSKDSNKKGDNLVEIEFKPTDKMSDFFKIKMIVNTKNYQPKSFKIYYNDGLRVTMKLEKFIKEKKYPTGFFTFDRTKYPGVKIEDLRL